MSAALADHFGLAWNFYAFAALNLIGAALAYWTVTRAPMVAGNAAPASGLLVARRARMGVLKLDPALLAACGIGFCIGPCIFGATDSNVPVF